MLLFWNANCLKSDLLNPDFGFELHTTTCHLKGTIRVCTWSCVFYQCWGVDVSRASGICLAERKRKAYFKISLFVLSPPIFGACSTLHVPRSYTTWKVTEICKKEINNQIHSCHGSNKDLWLKTLLVLLSFLKSSIATRDVNWLKLPVVLGSTPVTSRNAFMFLDSSHRISEVGIWQRLTPLQGVNKLAKSITQ